MLQEYVYPIDRRVPLSQLTQETNSIPTRSASTPYVPFCTPRKEGATDDMPACTELPQPPTFTVDEVERFQARFLESTDSRYALWLETFYPQSNAKARPGILETILRRPPPHSGRQTNTHLTVGRSSQVNNASERRRRKLRRKRRSRRRKRTE